MQKKYKVIYADPPWEYRDKRDKPSRLCGGATVYYPTMKIKDIQALPVKDIADTDSYLFLWVTFPNLEAGMETLKAWGFKYKTLGFSWLKLNSRFADTLLKLIKNVDKHGGVLAILEKLFFFGIGHYTKSNCEVCLIGVRGKPSKASDSVSSVVIAPRGKHSKKPEVVRERIVEFTGDVPRIELFSREQVEGWDCLGNDIDGKDIRQSMAELSRVKAGVVGHHLLEPVGGDS